MEKKSFWHYLWYNPPSLLGYWFNHLFKKHDPMIFWMYMSWNAPIND